MICLRRKFHHTSTVLLAFFACLCCGFIFSSSAFASSFTLNSVKYRMTNHYTNPTDDSWYWTRSISGGPWSSSEVRPPYDGNTWSPNTDRAIRFDSGEGVSRLHFETNNTTFQKNTLTAHFEINIVNSYYTGSNQNYNQNMFRTVQNGLDSLVFSNCNRTIGDQSITYAITPWAENWQVGPVLYFGYNNTITLYADVVLKDLPQGQNGNISCDIYSSNAMWAYMDVTYNKNNWFFIEKFENNYTYFDSYNDALTEMSNNILSQQQKLLEEQMRREQEAREKEERERTQFQGRSDSSTQEGNSAQSQTETATTSLLGAITGIYNVLLHPTRTNCNIGPLNIYGELDLGTLNMCQLKPPAQLAPLASLMAIALIIPLAWAVLHGAMSLYKDLFGGK